MTIVSMSPDLAFILTLALRMAVTAAFVVSASVITERAGPVIGALVATLPISAGPSYVFLARDHDAAFIAEAALASLPINAITIFLCLTYVVLAQRRSAAVSFVGAVMVWSALAALSPMGHWPLAGGLIANAVAYAICLPLPRQTDRIGNGIGDEPAGERPVPHGRQCGQCAPHHDCAHKADGRAPALRQHDIGQAEEDRYGVDRQARQRGLGDERRIVIACEKHVRRAG